MKAIKLSALALSLGLFAASCGNTESTTVETKDTVTVPTTGQEVEVKTEATTEVKTDANGDTTKVETTTEQTTTPVETAK